MKKQTDDKHVDWTWVGVGFTVVWLLIVACLVWRDWCRAMNMPLNEIGDALAGLFAPLAFAWLVVGYLLQRRQIALSLQSIAEERHALIEEREMRMLAVHPRLSVRGGTSISGGGGLQQHIVLRNFGGAAAEVSVHVNAADDGSYIDIGPLNHNEGREFQWTFRQQHEVVPVVVSMRDALNGRHTCSFTMTCTNGQFGIDAVQNGPAP